MLNAILSHRAIFVNSFCNIENKIIAFLIAISDNEEKEVVIMNNLSTIRKQRKLTQLDVAKALNIGQSTLSQYERGDRRIDDELLRKFCDFYQVSADEILNISTPKTKKIPKDLKKILEDEAITLNGRLVTEEDKEKMMRILEAAFYEAKEMNRRK